GVFSPEFVPIFADAFARLGRVRAWAVHGHVDSVRGMDEISPLGPTLVSRAEKGTVSHGRIDFSEFQLSPIESFHALRGGGREENARTIVGILRGEITDARRDFVLMNAAAGFVVAGLAPALRDGVQLALAQISSGRALATLGSARAA